jgi:hypothetical protein
VQTYPKRTETQRMAAETASNGRSSVELMDQTDESETLLRNLAAMIEEKRVKVKVKVYTKGRLHGKAYIFDYGDVYDLLGNHTLSLTQGQRYVLRELRILFGVTSDEDQKAQINLLEKALRGPITDAVKLNRIRRNGITGSPLLRTLGELYLQHRMRDGIDRPTFRLEDQPIPKVICSEALL